VRQKNLPDALVSLKRAMDLAPKEARYGYVYAVALHSAGRKREARTVVDAALKRSPGDRALSDLRAQLAEGK
jgi:predicted Zn-dependent protease